MTNPLCSQISKPSPDQKAENAVVFIGQCHRFNIQAGVGQLSASGTQVSRTIFRKREICSSLWRDSWFQHKNIYKIRGNRTIITDHDEYVKFHVRKYFCQNRLPAKG